MMAKQNPQPCSLLLLLAAAALCGSLLTTSVRAASRLEPQPAEPAPLAASSLLLTGAAPAGNLVVAGERGHILVSGDQGRSWRQAAVPVRAAITGLFFHEENSGWAVGHDAVILRTTDSGLSWQLKYRSVEEERPLFDIWFRDRREGFAIGAYGLCLRTSDAGETWSPCEIAAQNEIAAGELSQDDSYEYEDVADTADLHLNRIVAAGAGRLYIAAEAGNIFRSDDYGVTWTLLPSPYQGSFFGALPVGKDGLLVFGLRGNMFRSEDAGEHWSPVDTHTQAMLTDAVQLADGTIMVSGLNGILLVSRDGGYRFSLHQLPERHGTMAILPAGDDSLVLVGEAGVERISLSELLPDPVP